MRSLLLIFFLLIYFGSQIQIFGQSLNTSSLDSVNMSKENKNLLVTTFRYLQNIPLRHRYTQQFIDSLNKTPNLFNLPQIDSLRKSLTSEEAITLTKSDEPLLHLIGFWFIAERQTSQKDIISIFKRIANIQKKSYQLAFYCFCNPYAFDYFKSAELIPTLYICFDMITHKYPICPNCVLVTGKYRNKANRIIKEFNNRMKSEMITIN